MEARHSDETDETYMLGPVVVIVREGKAERKMTDEGN